MNKTKITDQELFDELERLRDEQKPYRMTVSDEAMAIIDKARYNDNPVSWTKITSLLIRAGKIPASTKDSSLKEYWNRVRAKR